MKCNRCGEPMEEGRAEVHGTMTATIVTGRSLQDLYWYDKGRQRKSRRRMIESKQAKRAFGCRACGLVTIDTTKTLKSKRGLRRG